MLAQQQIELQRDWKLKLPDFAFPSLLVCRIAVTHRLEFALILGIAIPWLMKKQFLKI